MKIIFKKGSLVLSKTFKMFWLGNSAFVIFKLTSHRIFLCLYHSDMRERLNSQQWRPSFASKLVTYHPVQPQLTQLLLTANTTVTDI